MATFTYTPWINGEIITSDKLNGHNCKLELTATDMIPDANWEIAISAGLKAKDFFNMIVVYNSSNLIIYKQISLVNIETINNINFIVLKIDPWNAAGYYNPTTGILTKILEG